MNINANLNRIYKKKYKIHKLLAYKKLYKNSKKIKC